MNNSLINAVGASLDLVTRFFYISVVIARQAILSQKDIYIEKNGGGEKYILQARSSDPESLAICDTLFLSFIFFPVTGEKPYYMHAVYVSR